MCIFDMPLSSAFWRYYVSKHLRPRIKCWLREMRFRLFGGWYCEYCGKIHNDNTFKFKLLPVYESSSAAVSDAGSLSKEYDPLDRFACSLGRDVYKAGKWEPTYRWPNLLDLLEHVSSNPDVLAGGDEDED